MAPSNSCFAAKLHPCPIHLASEEGGYCLAMADDAEFAFQLQLTEVLAASYVSSGLAEPPEAQIRSQPQVTAQQKHIKADEPAMRRTTRAPVRDVKKRKSSAVFGDEFSEEEEDVSQMCKICLEEKPGNQFLTVKTCGHNFCVDCVAQHVRLKVESSEVPVTCPESRCSGSICSEDCKDLQISKVVLDGMANLEALASIPEADRIYCPFPDCSALMTKPRRIRAQPSSAGPSAATAGPSSFRGSRMAGITSAECFTCHRLFCATCRVGWHGDLSCAQYQKGLLDGKSAESETLFRALVQVKKWKECAKCKSMIELKDGCIHMTCKCGYQFCYSCGHKWRSANCKCANTPIFGRIFRP